MKSKKSSKSSGSKKSLKKKKETINDTEPEVIENFVEEQQQPQEVIENFYSKELEEFFDQKVLCDKSTAPSPTHSVASSSFSWARERELENTNENLHEKLKDTEERYNSLKIQYESLSQVHRVLRESHVQLQE